MPLHKVACVLTAFIVMGAVALAAQTMHAAPNLMFTPTGPVELPKGLISTPSINRMSGVSSIPLTTKSQSLLPQSKKSFAIPARGFGSAFDAFDEANDKDARQKDSLNHETSFPGSESLNAHLPMPRFNTVLHLVQVESDEDFVRAMNNHIHYPVRLDDITEAKRNSLFFHKLQMSMVYHAPTARAHTKVIDLVGALASSAERFGLDFKTPLAVKLDALRSPTAHSGREQQKGRHKLAKSAGKSNDEPLRTGNSGQDSTEPESEEAFSRRIEDVLSSIIGREIAEAKLHKAIYESRLSHFLQKSKLSEKQPDLSERVQTIIKAYRKGGSIEYATSNKNTIVIPGLDESNVLVVAEKSVIDELARRLLSLASWSETDILRLLEMGPLPHKLPLQLHIKHLDQLPEYDGLLLPDELRSQHRHLDVSLYHRN